VPRAQNSHPSFICRKFPVQGGKCGTSADCNDGGPRTFTLVGLCDAIREALEHGTPRVSSVAFLVRKHQRSRERQTPMPVDLSQHAELATLNMQPQNLEVFDGLAKQNDDEK